MVLPEEEALCIGGPANGEFWLVNQSKELWIQSFSSVTGPIHSSLTRPTQYEYVHYRLETITIQKGDILCRSFFWVLISIPETEWVIFMAKQYAALANRKRGLENKYDPTSTWDGS